MRITDRILQMKVDQINKAAGTPLTYATKQITGENIINIGHYHLDHAYGGVKLVQTLSLEGDIHCITPSYAPKRELHGLLCAFLSGLESRQ